MVKIVGIRGSIKVDKCIAAGIRKHGDIYEQLDIQSDELKSADGFLQINEIKPKFRTINKDGPYEYILDSKKPFLVKESSVFRKYPEYKRLGWWSYKWTQGEFGNENASSDRWNKFVKETNITLKDWKSPGDTIIIMGQKPGDSSLVDLFYKGQNFTDWMTDTVRTIRKFTDRKIIIRPHPRNINAGLKGANFVSKNNKNVYVSTNLTRGGNQGGEGLDADLAQAHCIVTYNSLSAVEAVCEGIPVFAMHNGSMAWPIAHKKLSNIENLNYNIDRTQWCNEVAYTQWTAAEDMLGESWEHLRPLMFKT